MAVICATPRDDSTVRWNGAKRWRPPRRIMTVELNPAQAQAVAQVSGPVLVFAGAGSGKTRTIIYRIAHLLSLGVPPYRVLAVTFTNKAAAEMRERLHQLVGEALTRDLWVGTFHATCAKLLRRYHADVGLERNFVIYDESDQKAVVQRLLREMQLSDRDIPPKWLLSKIRSLKQEGAINLSTLAGPLADDRVAALIGRYQQSLATSNAVDFEDLLLHVMHLVEQADAAAGRELRDRFQYLLVDEFQDTNLVQYRILRALSAQSRNLCVVGDDDQSIYRWRGADVRIIRGFRKDFADAQVIKLEQNYRSTGNIVKAALAVIEPSATREPKQLWTEQEPGSPVMVRGLTDERQEAAWVCERIRARLGQGLDPKEVAVFYRVHAQSRVLEEALRGAELPYQVVGGTRFFDRAEVKDVLAYLRLIDNPRSDADLLRIINVPPRGIGARSIERLIETALRCAKPLFECLDDLVVDSTLASAARTKLCAFRDQVRSWQRNGTDVSPHQLASTVVEESGYRRSLELQDSAEADARLGNVEELLGSIAEHEAELQQAGQTPTLTAYLERVSLVNATDSLTEGGRVSLMTVHAAKGLEFDTVFLTGMEDDVFPYRRLDAEGPEELEEERRLAYVALTRARRHLVITYAWQRTLFGQTRYLKKSTFLHDLPEAVVDEQSVATFGAGAIEGGRTPPWSCPPTRGPMASRPEPNVETRTIDRTAFDDLPPSAPAFRRGQAVWHARFGKGRVENVEMGNGSQMVVACFPGFGTRKVMAEFLAATPT